MSFTTFVLVMIFLQGAAGGFPSVAADAGTIHVVWQDDSAGNAEVYYSHSTGSDSFATPLNISRNPGISDLPRVVVHENSVSVVWSDTSTGTYQVMLAQSEDGGSSFGPARTLSDGLASTGPPDVAFQDGRLYVVWDETENDGENRIIYWDSDGSRRTISGGSRGLVPSIAVRGGRLIVAWHTEFEYKQRVYAVQSDDSGHSFSQPVLISPELEQSVTPSVSIAPNGRGFIAWSDRTSGKSEIFLASTDRDGHNYSVPRVIASSARESIFPAIQMITDDDIAIAWTTRNSIIYARISAAGEAKEPARALANSDTAGVPRLAVDAGRQIVVWKDWGASRAQIFISKDKAPGKLLFSMGRAAPSP